MKTKLKSIDIFVWNLFPKLSNNIYTVHAIKKD